MSNAYLLDLAIHLPDGERTNEDLCRINPDWEPEKIFAKTGIRRRRVVQPGETASDLGLKAAETLLTKSGFDRSQIDAILFCTQSPDYYLPTTACLLQNQLGLPTNCAALDYNLGCSGFTYGLWLARSLVLSGSANNVLLITADTYSRYCDPRDLTTVTIFGDAGAAALICNDSQADQSLAKIGVSIVGADGRGGPNLIVKHGCGRSPAVGPEARQPEPIDARLFMNGPEIFSFTLSSVRAGVTQLLEKVQWSLDDVDWFILHQANRFMLEKLRDHMKLPKDKTPIDLENTGNTVSASIPVLMSKLIDQNRFQAGQKLALAGFGVGYSWAMTSLIWQKTQDDTV